MVSQRLTKTPAALVASSYGWSGNMERIMRSQAYAKANDPTQDFYANQKKTFEINPRHPVIKELLTRVEVRKYCFCSKLDSSVKHNLEFSKFKVGTILWVYRRNLPTTSGLNFTYSKVLKFLKKNVSFSGRQRGPESCSHGSSTIRNRHSQIWFPAQRSGI